MKYEEMDKSELLMEIYHLKRKLDEYIAQYGLLDDEESTPYLDISMNKEEKLRVIMDYFDARKDIVAERYISKKDGRKRYSLGCLNKFNRMAGCDIEHSHCKNCPVFLPKPYDEKAIEGHMNHEQLMIGIYPMLEGNCVKFLVFDLDESTYLEDASKLRSVLHSLAVYPVLERSQSGHGIHVWVFFEEKIKAADARRIANYVLTEAMDRFGGFDFESYDRVFPNQDKVEKGGYGNCVALPLNKQCGEAGNTMFLDGEFRPIRKPIEYLSTITKVSKNKAKELLEFASQKDEYGLFGDKAMTEMSLSKDDFMGVVRLHYAGDVYIPLLDLTQRSKRFLGRISSILNKEYFKLLNARRSVYNVPKILPSYIIDDRYFRLPRGFKEPLVRLLKQKGIPYELDTSLTKGVPIEVRFQGTLRQNQTTLLEKALGYDSAVVSAPTGFGKTVLAAAMIERKKTKTLILVPSVALLNQWLEKLEEFIAPDYPYKKRPFGSLTGKGDFLEGFIDVATVQSLVRNEGFRKKAKGYGMVLVDEVHHMAAVKYEEALRDLSPKYLYGLTATPQRSDERESFIFHSFGPLVELQDERQPAGFIKYYHPRFTKFSSSLDGSDIMGLLTEATRDQERNRLIVEDVLSSYQTGGKVLVLTERIEHARVLYNLLKKEAGDFVALLYGGQDKEERKENQRLLDEGFGKDPFIVISIGKYIGEGFDDDRFTSLFITYPFRWKGMLSQYCGRLQRKETAVKQVDVYDYVDPLVSAFSKMYRAREKGYFELGYKLVGLDPKYRSDILDHEAFESRLKDDLRDAKSSALLFVSYAHEGRLKHIVSSLTCPTSVFVCGGLDVGDVSPISRLPKEIPSLILLDDRILYYGGINPFVYGQKDGTIMRIEDPSIASQIRDSLLNSN